MSALPINTPPLPDPEQADTAGVIRWALERFDQDRLALSTAFGPSGVVLCHLVSQLAPGVRVFFVDTGLHFAQTLAMVARLEAALPIQVEVVRPLLSLEEQVAAHGADLYARDPDTCCALRKVEPTRRVLAGLDAWMTGLRRDQGPSRAHTPLIDPRPQGGRTVYKINPLAGWTQREVWRHIFEFSLPYNPLHDEGFPSVGCAPCTRAVRPGEGERGGRWAGQGKTECGLHTLL